MYEPAIFIKTFVTDLDATLSKLKPNAKLTQLQRIPLAKMSSERVVGHKTAKAIRYNERSTVERVNALLKDEFGGWVVRVRGHAKVICHLMFGVLALTANQILILAT